MSVEPGIRRRQAAVIAAVIGLSLLAGALCAGLPAAHAAPGQPDITGPQEITAVRGFLLDPPAETVARPPADYRPLVLFIVALAALGFGLDLRRRLR